MSLPLEGLKVLDLSRYLPGPLATQILGDFGAEVIKIEDRKGELGRYLEPMIKDTSALFYTVNRNKRSMGLDLKKPEGKEIFKKLVADADIVVDQFRPDVMNKLGLGYEVLKEINPRIIYCIITGYGLTGPMRDAAGHDLNYLNIAGVTELMGTKDGPPAMSGVQIADTAGGSMYSVIAILLALAAREKTGEGQLCDVAMMDGALSLLSYTIGEWSGGDGTLPKRGGEMLTGGYAAYNIYECKDGRHVSLAAVEDKFWASFCRKLGVDEYIPLHIDIPHQEYLQDSIRKIMLSKTRDEWVEFFSDSDLCFTPVLSLDEMVKHPQVLARDMVHTLTNFQGSGKDLVCTGVPIKLSETPGEAKMVFAGIGENTDEILASIGYSTAQIEQLHKDGIV
ncbi:CaiB/BaiF CoA transferase family protein [Desulfosporosinus youngiae]|uniref:Putative acyl-CoA transferase/carnitine dehydratase n=1 Tax=Desulfosporosinus youngiae DSM 17734 TaxID=768710 RepID=H5XZ80_9FIRM|nr:CaiB/BaiF CoA-transferase family protein [Desulfosporosinus youngiae]EHQ91786.1 putative acyl-CoA transferase/carnitine dehydratase [Desulfosporosinus youngiae DSM 17734]